MIAVHYLNASTISTIMICYHLTASSEANSIIEAEDHTLKESDSQPLPSLIYRCGSIPSSEASGTVKNQSTLLEQPSYSNRIVNYLI